MNPIVVMVLIITAGVAVLVAFRIFRFRKEERALRAERDSLMAAIDGAKAMRDTKKSEVTYDPETGSRRRFKRD